MLRLWRGSLTKGLATILCILVISWLALEYFIPSPPSRITIATAPKGTSFDYFGERYRERFARAGVKVDLRETAGESENFRLLQDPNSGVQISFVGAGTPDSRQAPKLLSVGLIANVPYWIFYSSTESLDSLPQLKGKRIAVGPEGSGPRNATERMLSKANINSKTATLLPYAGSAAADALNDGKVDVAFILSAPEAPAVRALLANPRVRLMVLPTAEGVTRIFPDLVRLVLPEGAIEIDPPNPPNDVTLIGTTARVLIRDDVHPAIVQLLARIMKEEHEGPGLFQRSGEFPKPIDPKFPVAQIAIDYYKNGPSLLQGYLPFWMTIYAQRMIALMLATLAIVFPVFTIAPRLYGWFVREHLGKLYRRLRVVENALQAPLTAAKIETLQRELADIDQAAGVLPMRNSDLYFMLRYHLDRTRSRLVEASQTAEAAGGRA